MALAQRAQGEFTAAYGDNWRVTLYEEGYGGSSIDLEFQNPGFTLTYQPDTNDIATPIIPSFCNLHLINNSAAIDTLISDLIAKQQTDFFVEIERGISGGSYSMYWRGAVLQDEINEMDMSKPRPLSIGCTDGLTLLQAVDYDFANTVATASNKPEHTPLVALLDKCLEQALDQTLWGGSEPYLVTSVDWWETSQTYSAVTDPLASLVVDVRGFREVKQTSGGNDIFGVALSTAVVEIEYLTCWEILEQLCLAFMCRVYQHNGAWHFEQVSLRASNQTKWMTYTTSLGTGAYTNATTLTILDQTRKKARLARNQFTYFPALSRIEVLQDAYGANFIPEMNFRDDDYTETQTKTFGTWAASINNAAASGAKNQQLFFEIVFNASGQFQYVSGDWVSPGPFTFNTIELRQSIDITIKIDDAYSATNYWWDGSAWQTSAQTITEVSTQTKAIFSSGTGSGTLLFHSGVFGSKVINTDDLPATGVLSITLDNPKIEVLTSYNPKTYATVSQGDLFTYLGLVTLRVKGLIETGDTKFLYTLDNPNPDIADSNVLKYPTLYLGDKAIQSGHIMYDNGTSIEACSDWQEANNANGLVLPSLLAQQRMALQSEPMKRLEGQVLFIEGYGESIGFNSEIYVPHDYEFKAQTGEVSGTFNKLAIYATLGNPNDNFGGSTFTSGYNARQVNASAVIQDIYRRTQAIDYDELNGITLQTGLSASLSGKNRTTQVINAEAAASDTLAYTDHVVFLDWTGGDGTFTLNLPAVVTGVEFVIITDSTITAARDIAITPDGAETINGAAELSITGAGMITIRAANGEWHGY